MQIKSHQFWSKYLNRQMQYRVYGHGGKPVLFFPCQGGRFWDFESFHMVDYWAKWIENGKCMVFSLDTIDNETWADKGGNPAYRIRLHEDWIHYIIEELVPIIRTTSGREDIMTFGCSMGAMHAANLYYRRPDIFDRCLAISGIYDNEDSFGTYCDELVYGNCPVLYLENLPEDHWYRSLYRQQKSLIVCGQGAWEEVLLASTRRLDEVCCRKGIPTRFEYWGYDVDHDWPWWYKMVDCYVPELLK